MGRRMSTIFSRADPPRQSIRPGAVSLLFGRVADVYDRKTMSSQSDLGAPEQSIQFARARDRRIGWLLDTYPVTAAMLVWRGFFPNENKAIRRLGRLVRCGRVRRVGTVSRGPGRPDHV